MLIVVSLLVFYNELDSKMNIAEIALLALTMIAIIRASLNYIQMSDTISEGFTNNNRPIRKHRGKNNNKNGDDTDGDENTEIISQNADEYFDSDNNTEIDITNKTDKFNTVKTNTNYKIGSTETNGKISTDAVNQVNSLLGISKFDDITNTTVPNATNATNNSSGIESKFEPKIIIGSGAQKNNNNSNSLDGSYGLNGQFNITDVNFMQNNQADWKKSFTNDSMTFPNTMAPSTNLWGTATNYGILTENDSDAWTQSLNDYNNGRWNPRLYTRPSDYTDYYTPSAYGMSTPHSGQPQTANQSKSTNSSTSTTPTEPTKRCGVYDDLSLDQAGNLVVRNYTEAKKWYPGYTYVPPVYWDVPQRHTSVCNPNSPDYRKLTGLVDRGLPMNVLELNPDGTQANTEDSVKLSNVGSIMPPFNYQEQPFSKPYV